MNWFLPDVNGRGWSRRKKAGFAVLAVCLLMVVGWPFLRGPLDRMVARKHRAEGAAFLRQGKLNQAQAALMKSLARNPRDAEALRTAAAVAFDRGAIFPAYQFLKSLIGAGQGSVDDQRNFLRAAIELGRLDEAEPQLRALELQSGDHPATLKLWAQFFHKKGFNNKTEEVLRKLLQASPNDAGAQLLLADLLLSSQNTERQSEGKSILGRLANLRDGFGLQAIRRLTEIGQLTMIEARMAQELLEKHPMRGIEDELVMAELQAQVTPYKRKEIISQVAAGTTRMAARLRWLIRQEAFDQVLALTNGENVRENREVVLARLDVLAALNRWEEVEALLAQSSKVLPQSTMRIYQARTAGELQQVRLAELYWDQAFGQSRGDSAAMRSLAEYAEKAGVTGIAERAWLELIQMEERPRNAEERLLQYYRQVKNTQGLRSVLEKMAAKYPDDWDVATDLLYLKLLQNEGDLETALSLFGRRGNFFAVRCTYGLALLKSGEDAKAVALFHDLSIPWGVAGEGLKAVYISILARGGFTNQARQLEAELNKTLLLAEELQLLEECLSSRDSSAGNSVSMKKNCAFEVILYGARRRSGLRASTDLNRVEMPHCFA